MTRKDAMFPISLSSKTRGQAYLVTLSLAAMLVRALLGVAHPGLDLAQTMLIGLTTILLVAPSAYRWWFDAPLLAPERRVRYGLVTAMAVGMFLYFVAFGG